MEGRLDAQGDGITPYEIDGNIYGPVSTPSTRDAYTSVSEWDQYFRFCNSNTDISIKNSTYPIDRPLYVAYCGPLIVNETNNSQGSAPILEFVNSGFPDTIDYRNITFWSAEYQTAEKLGVFIPYKVGDYVFYNDSLDHTRFYCCIQDHAGNFDPNISPMHWSLKTWSGNNLPPLDLRMKMNSYYDSIDIGLIYNDLGTNVGITDLPYSPTNFNIYPNPTNSTIQIQSNEEILEIVFMNIAGREVLRKDNYISGNPIDVLSLAPGIYVAVVSYKNH